jgi:hypothetical protein
MLDLIAKGQDVAANPQHFRNRSAGIKSPIPTFSAKPQNTQALTFVQKSRIKKALNAIDETDPDERLRVMKICESDLQEYEKVINILRQTKIIMNALKLVI